MKIPKRLWVILFWVLCALFLAAGLFLKYALVGYSFLSLVCFFLLAVLLAYGLLFLLKRRNAPWGKRLLIGLTVLLCVGFLIVAITECFIIHASFGDPTEHCQYMVVLGCLVKNGGPSVSLQNRIDAAYDYLCSHPDTIAVLSGGKGEPEPISEAQCMYDALVARGIDPERLWMEDEATSTWENLQYSLDLIEDRTGTRPSKIGILSSEYHLFRASLLAKEQGVKTLGIPAKTTVPSQALNHFLREVAGVWHYILLGGQYD